MGDVSTIERDWDLHQAITELLEDYRKGDVLEMAFVYRKPHETGNSAYRTVYHFFGKDSTINILGLIEYLSMHVRDYLRDNDLSAD